MAQPVIVQDATLRCDAAHTLSGLLRHVAIAMSVSGLSRFLKSPAWSAEALTVVRQERFNAQVAAEVAEVYVRKRAQRSRRAGRPSKTVVTGFLIMDDSPHVKRYAREMEGQGWRYSSSDKFSMPGHSLFQSVYYLLGRQLPLTPQIYRQKVVCEREQVPFRSKVDLAVQTIGTFMPPADTQTHVLIDSWYVNKRVWRTTHQRGWDLTGGLKSSRQLRQTAPDAQRILVSVTDYAANLPHDSLTPVMWPNQEGGEIVHGHLVRTKVKKLGAYQVLIVKPTLDAPRSQCRYWVTSRPKRHSRPSRRRGRHALDH